MFEKFIGNQSEPILSVVEKGAVKKFAESIGDFNPLYFDEKYVKTTSHPKLIAPSTFPRTFDFGEKEILQLPSSGVIHAEQMYSYERPLYVGDQLNCYTEVMDVYEKEGNKGLLTFFILQQNALDIKGKKVLQGKRVLILNEKVREKLLQQMDEVKSNER